MIPSDGCDDSTVAGHSEGQNNPTFYFQKNIYIIKKYGKQNSTGSQETKEPPSKKIWQCQY